MSPQDRLDELLGREVAGETLSAGEMRELDLLATGPLKMEREALKAVATEAREKLRPPAFDADSVHPSEPPAWMLSELEAAVGIKPWADVKERAVAARSGRTGNGNTWLANWMRWGALAALVIAVSIPAVIYMRDGESQHDQIRGWQGREGAAPVLLAPIGSTSFRQPAFIWLPAAGQTGPVRLTLSAHGKAIWTQESARSPFRLSEATGAPTLEPDVTYEWSVEPLGGVNAVSTFTLDSQAKGRPEVFDHAADAMKAASAAAAAGRPADGIMILALLPTELRSDESVRALRKQLTQALPTPIPPPAEYREKNLQK